MIIRIDLLDPSERRYLGPVSVRFATRTIALTAIALLLLGISGAIFNGIECRRALERGRARWKEMEPRYEIALRFQRLSRDLRRYLDEIEGWTAVRLSVPGMLDELQRVVPPEIQLTRLEVRDEISAPRPKSAEEAVTPYRLLRWRLGGRVVGPRSEETVGQLIIGLREMGAPEALFRSVTLLTIQADPLSSIGISTFEIDAMGAPRIMAMAEERGEADAPAPPPLTQEGRRGP